MSDTNTQEVAGVEVNGVNYPFTSAGLARLADAFGTTLAKSPSWSKDHEQIMFQNFADDDELVERVEVLADRVRDEIVNYCLNTHVLYKALYAMPMSVDCGTRLGEELAGLRGREIAGLAVGNRNATGARKSFRERIRRLLKS